MTLTMRYLDSTLAGLTLALTTTITTLVTDDSHLIFHVTGLAYYDSSVWKFLPWDRILDIVTTGSSQPQWV